MKVLLTGGAGFIGSHLAERLLAGGDEVICLDSFDDFYDPAIKQRNIERALAHPKYTLVTGDILDRELLEHVFERHGGIGCVAHLAAYAGVRPSIERPESYQRVNIEGTLNLLERARIHEVPRFVFASSSSVYGGRTDVPFRETDDVTRPVSPYAATKVAGETLCHAYHHLFGLAVHVLRFFTVYGPRQRPEMAIHLFASRMLRGRPLRLFGDGKSRRDYTYIDDVVAGVAASIERCAGFEVLNLGNSSSTALDELAALLGRRLGLEPVIELEPEQPGDVPLTFADISRAERILGYRPRVDIADGIDRFCAWLEEKRRAG